jgi:hypothetical protein
VLSRVVEHHALKEQAALLTQVDDHLLERVLEESKAERLRLQEEDSGDPSSSPHLIRVSGRGG